jgi:hypothetical protein
VRKKFFEQRVTKKKDTKKKIIGMDTTQGKEKEEGISVPRDIACLLKELADPLTYGRLLCVSHAFYDSIDRKRYCRKLRQLIETLPSGEKAKKTRSAYIFFCKKRRPEIKDELPDLKAHEVMQLLGVEWRRMTVEQKEPYQRLSDADSERYRKQSNPENLKRLISQRNAAITALHSFGNDESGLLLAAHDVIRKQNQMARSKYYETIRKQSRKGVPHWQAIGQGRKEARKIRKRKRGMTSGWQCYVKEKRSEAMQQLQQQQRQNNPKTLQQEVMRRLAQNWKALTPEQKEPYNQRAHQDRIAKARLAIDDAI